MIPVETKKKCVYFPHSVDLINEIKYPWLSEKIRSLTEIFANATSWEKWKDKEEKF